MVITGCCDLLPEVLDATEIEGHTSPSSCSGSTATSLTGDLHQDPSSAEVPEGEEEWEQVGPKNKSTITRQVGCSRERYQWVWLGVVSRSSFHY